MRQKSVALAMVVILFFSLLSSSPASAQHSELVGRKVRLKAFEPIGIIYVGVDKKMFNLVIGNLMSKDRGAYLDLTLDHKVFEVDNNTIAKLLEFDFWAQAAKVEVLNGPYAGHSGWVLIDQIEEF
jgi:hypothetical protein